MISSLFVDLTIPECYRFLQLVEIMLLPMLFLYAMEHMRKKVTMVLKAAVQKESPKQSLPKVTSEAAVRRCSSK